MAKRAEGELTPAAIGQLANTKLQLGASEPDPYEFLRLAEDSEWRLRVETINQYLEAKRKGAVAYNTFEITMEEYFEIAAASLKFLGLSRPAKTNQLDSRLLEQLSIEILWPREDDSRICIQRDTELGLTLKDYARRQKLAGWKLAANEVQFQFCEVNYVLSTLARGDFDGDGCDDALIVMIWNYISGTGRGLRHYWLSAPLSPSESSGLNLSEFRL